MANEHELPEALDSTLPPELSFTPVPRLRRMRNGWSELRQRAFIAALSECGSVARAARSVGMTPRSAYRLMDAEGADEFAVAWDRAIETGIGQVRAAALDGALHGAMVKVFRSGKLVRIEQRRNDRLAIALLGGRDRSIDDYRRTAVSRRAYRQDLRAYDEAKSEERRKAEEVWAAHQAVLDEIEREKRRAKPAPLPRIRSL